MLKAFQDLAIALRAFLKASTFLAALSFFYSATFLEWVAETYLVFIKEILVLINLKLTRRLVFTLINLAVTLVIEKLALMSIFWLGL